MAWRKCFKWLTTCLSKQSFWSRCLQTSGSCWFSLSCPFVLFVCLLLFLSLPCSPLCLVTGRAAVRSIKQGELDIRASLFYCAPNAMTEQWIKHLVAAHGDGAVLESIHTCTQWQWCGQLCMPQICPCQIRPALLRVIAAWLQHLLQQCFVMLHTPVCVTRESEI